MPAPATYLWIFLKYTVHSNIEFITQKLTSNNSPKTDPPAKIKGNPWCHVVQNPMKEPDIILGISKNPNLRPWNKLHRQHTMNPRDKEAKVCEYSHPLIGLKGK